MKRLKTFATYILIIVIFYIFSNVMIFVGLNNTYNRIYAKETIPEGVSVITARATSVNGELKGTISENISSKYVKFNFYTDNDTLMGSYYITPDELENNNFDFYFKLNYIDYYTVELTDEKTDIASSDNFSEEEFKKYALLTALVALMFI